MLQKIMNFGNIITMMNNSWLKVGRLCAAGINETTKLSFEHSLKNSLDVLKAALEEHKELEGDQKTREEALKKVRILSREIWENHVITEIK